MAPPRVTIGLPFLNAERTLPDALRSIFAQTFTDWQLLLLDDGSTDGSLQLARAVRDPRVTVRSDGQNRGLAARLNELATKAEAPLLARMDADDLMHPERLARQVAWFEAHPETDALGTGTYTMDAGGQLHGQRWADPIPTTVAEVLRRELFVHPTVMFRTAFARAHPYDPGYPRAEDVALWCTIRPTAQLAVLPRPLHFYREPLAMDLPAYLATSRSKARLITAPATGLDPVERAVLLGELHLKRLAYKLASALGGRGLLVQTRNRALFGAERAEAESVLRELERVRVPGFV